ncbi:MAG: hypothetical protein K8R23_02390 [Chthoniobacter sp.]|nr:hypothetical protein [Chthoniobacter sp.]
MICPRIRAFWRAGKRPRDTGGMLRRVTCGLRLLPVIVPMFLSACGKEEAWSLGGGLSFEAVAVAPDGSMVVARDDKGWWSSTDHRWRAFRLTDGKELFTFPDLAKDWFQVAFLGSKTLVATTPTGILFFDLDQRKEVVKFKDQADFGGAVVASADGRRLATFHPPHHDEAGKWTDVRVWDVETERLAGTIEHAFWATNPGTSGVGLSADGKTLVGVDDQGMARLYDVGSGKEIRRIGPVEAKIQFSPDGTKLAALHGGMLKGFDVASGKENFRLADHSPEFAFSPDSKLIAVQRWVQKTDGFGRPTEVDSAVYLADTTTGKMVRQIHTKQGTLRGLCFSPDGRLLAEARTGKLGGRLTVYKLTK